MYSVKKRLRKILIFQFEIRPRFNFSLFFLNSTPHGCTVTNICTRISRKKHDQLHRNVSNCGGTNLSSNKSTPALGC